MVVMQHPITTEYEKAREQINETLYAIQGLDIPTFWFWPNVDAGSDGTSNGIRSFREREKAKNIHFFKNMEPTDFLRLVYNSNAIVGNSSVAIRECSFLGAPAVNIGTRQSGRERGTNVIDVDYKRDHITSAIREHLHDAKRKPSTIYGDGSAGPRIAELLQRLPHRIEKRLTY
ncbi:MAG: UDP-N-acetylglucosamine 2-epimerase [Limisphaerales bacterium]